MVDTDMASKGPHGGPRNTGRKFPNTNRPCTITEDHDDAVTEVFIYQAGVEIEAFPEELRGWVRDHMSWALGLTSAEGCYQWASLEHDLYGGRIAGYHEKHTYWPKERREY